MSWGKILGEDIIVKGYCPQNINNLYHLVRGDTTKWIGGHFDTSPKKINRWQKDTQNVAPDHTSSEKYRWDKYVEQKWVFSHG